MKNKVQLPSYRIFAVPTSGESLSTDRFGLCRPAPWGLSTCAPGLAAFGLMQDRPAFCASPFTIPL